MLHGKMKGSGPAVNLLEQEGRVSEKDIDFFYSLSGKGDCKEASVMLCPGVMKRIGRLFPDGFYLMPFSIHEVLILPKEEGIGTKEHKEMVANIFSELQASEWKEEVDRIFLSDKLYEYDSRAGAIIPAGESGRKEIVKER